VREPHARHLPERRVRLLRGLGVDARAHPALLRGAAERGRRLLRDLLGASALHELIDRRHKAKTDLLRTQPVAVKQKTGHHATVSAGRSGTASSSAPSGSSVTASMLLYFCTPVPAGISRPMMTFSLSPTRRSTLPLIAASVSTLVVSWNDAAEMKLSVESDALVMPSSNGSAIAGSPPLSSTRAFSSSNRHFSTWSPTRKSVSPTSLIRTRRSIWRTITSMCLSLMRTPCSR